MSDPGARRTDVETRRQQIVDAASACARRAGFHGSSMAEIAQQAGMSVGQIYRYFDSKEAIIAAIVARDMAEMRDKYCELQSSGVPVRDAILNKCVNAIDDLYASDRAALMLEVVAEAARNPDVAAILQAADAEERKMQQALLRQAFPADLDDRERAARGEVISMLFEGLPCRGVNNPGGDRAAISAELRSVLHHLMTRPGGTPKG
ncbi:TetR/AcrR family transcriptional regulator [Phenylobacterium sp. J367]|uniref:TetR/AcrR family transcriptional regulator n=1 Tax=Phenylobacterium sp. J367 TaxID=2898435 RepID=UPI002150D1E1|nr:TetR/AcrR family transcriptional regulator [Phenylobacterium sp. J367]MCR5877172.1 TetR/AcrR family transcriptional regulator [Phenylobacterium sp. J367]